MVSRCAGAHRSAGTSYSALACSRPCTVLPNFAVFQVYIDPFLYFVLPTTLASRCKRVPLVPCGGESASISCVRQPYTLLMAARAKVVCVFTCRTRTLLCCFLWQELARANYSDAVELPIQAALRRRHRPPPARTLFFCTHPLVFFVARI